MSFPIVQSNPPTPPSLIERSGHLLDRVCAVADRLEHLSSRLFGPEPKSASTGQTVSEPVANLALNTQRSHAVLDRINAEFEKIESRL